MPANKTIPKRLLMAAAANRSRKPILYDELGRSLTFDRMIIGCAVLSRKIEALSHRHHVGCLLPNSVTGVVATLIADHVVDPTTEQVGRLALALIAPLGADEHYCGHG